MGRESRWLDAAVILDLIAASLVLASLVWAWLAEVTNTFTEAHVIFHVVAAPVAAFVSAAAVTCSIVAVVRRNRRAVLVLAFALACLAAASFWILTLGAGG